MRSHELKAPTGDTTGHFRFPSIVGMRDAESALRRLSQMSVSACYATATTKLHGTNAAIGYSAATDKLWAQSRNRVLRDSEPDNHGFRAFVVANRDRLVAWFRHIDRLLMGSPRCGEGEIVLFGEWCGRGVAKGVGVAAADPKRLVLFAAVLHRYGVSEWLPVEHVSGCLRISPGFGVGSLAPAITCVSDYGSSRFVGSCGDLLIWAQAAADAVGDDCPVARAWGTPGPGEGVVIHAGGVSWKVKARSFAEGGKRADHGSDADAAAAMDRLVDAVCDERRMEQGLAYLTEQGLQAITENTGAFVRWVAEDALCEEAGVVSSSGLPPGAVRRAVSKRAAWWYRAERRAHGTA